jgi:hypothetical protein
MPFVKGQPRPPGSGRKKGTPNRATLLRPLIERIAAGEVGDPVRVLNEIMEGPRTPLPLRLRAAEILCEYAYPRLRTVEVSGPGGAPLLSPASAADLKAALQRALAEVARERAALRGSSPGVVVEGVVEPRPLPTSLEAADAPAATADATDAAATAAATTAAAAAVAAVELELEEAEAEPEEVFGPTER